MVQMGKVEFPRPKTLEPKSSASTSSATSANGEGGEPRTLTPKGNGA